MMGAVSTRSPLRSAAVALGVPLLVVALFLLRSATQDMSDTEVRGGVSTRAVVLDADGHRATVRIALPDSDVVTDVSTRRPYTAGDSIPVVYDPVDPTRASEQGAPATSSPLERGLVVVGLCALALGGTWALTRRSPEQEQVERDHAQVIRGGRAVEPERARS